MEFDATFWALIGLILFLAIVIYMKAPGQIGRSLDQRAEKIRNELEQARELKEEAKQQLAEYQRRRREAEEEAREMIEGARREAELIVQEARVKSQEYITRRTALAEQKIAQAEADAVAEVRATAVDLGVAAAARIIGERNSGAEGGRFLDSSIGEVRARLV